MARAPEILEDPTPLDATHVDVRVRIAWLLRSWRTHGSDGQGVSVTDMAGLLKQQDVPASPPSVSGWETGRVAPGPAVVEAYESVLGLEPGCLRAVVDLVRRQFGDERPRSAVSALELPDLDLAVDRVVRASPPRGLDWLHLCEAALAVRPGLPAALLRPLVAQLLNELTRSGFTPYTTRYEALALLRGSVYGELVADVAADFIAEPGNLLLGDAAGVLAERPDGRAIGTLAPYLDSDEFLRLRAAVVGLGFVASGDGPRPSAWTPVVGPFTRAWARHADDGPRRQQLAELWPALPSSIRDEVTERLDTPVDVEPAPLPWEPGGRADQLAICRHTADRVTRAVGAPAQPLLARLLFEALFEERYARRITSALLLMASPFRGPLAVEVGLVARDHDDVRVRRAAATLLLLIGREESHALAGELLDSDEPAIVTGALFVLMHSDAPLPTTRVKALLRLPEPLDHRAIFYAGMTGHPVLAEVAANPSDPLRPVALWWQRHGTRVDR